MKNGKRPTRREKILLGEKRLNIENWLVTKRTSTELEIVHKYSGKTRVIELSR